MSASRCCVCVFAGMTARLDVSGRKERPSSASVVHPASGKDASRKGISFFICSIQVDECWNDDRRNLAGRIICDVEGDVLSRTMKLDRLPDEATGAAYLQTGRASW